MARALFIIMSLIGAAVLMTLIAPHFFWGDGIHVGRTTTLPYALFGFALCGYVGYKITK